MIVGTGAQTLDRYRAREHDIYLGAWGPDYPDPNTNAGTFAFNPDNSDEAETLNRDRKVCLKLLYSLYDWAHKDEGKEGNESSDRVCEIKKSFKDHRIKNILLFTLVMDRA